MLGLAAILGTAMVAGHVSVDQLGTGAEAGWQVEPRPSAGPSSASPGVLLAEPPDWWAVLAELDRRRATTLAALDLDALADHAQPGAPAWDADAALLADMQERAVHPEGLTSSVLAVERAERQGELVRLLIVDQRSAYELVDAQGEVIDRVGAALPTRWAVTLRRGTAGDRGWRLVEVSPAPGPSPAEGEEAP